MQFRWTWNCDEACDSHNKRNRNDFAIFFCHLSISYFSHLLHFHKSLIYSLLNIQPLRIYLIDNNCKQYAVMEITYLGIRSTFLWHNNSRVNEQTIKRNSTNDFGFQNSAFFLHRIESHANWQTNGVIDSDSLN